LKWRCYSGECTVIRRIYTRKRGRQGSERKTLQLKQKSKWWDGFKEVMSP
jgi:hypothetical protein